MSSISKRTKRRLHNEAMEVIIGCFTVFGFLSAMLPTVAQGPIGIMMLGGGSLMVCLYVVGMVRWGDNLRRSIFVAVLAAACAYGLAYGGVWFFTHYLASQPDLLKFK